MGLGSWPILRSRGARPLSRTPINRTFFTGAMRLRHSRAVRAIVRRALLGRGSVTCQLSVLKSEKRILTVTVLNWRWCSMTWQV